MTMGKHIPKVSIIANWKANFNSYNNASLVLGLILITVAWLVFKFIYPAERIFALIVIASLVITILFMVVVHFLRSDSTESIAFSRGDISLVIKSPSKQLMPTIANLLLANVSRPTKLIPRGVTLEEDPSKFQSLTDQEKEQIVRREVEEAVSEVEKDRI